MNKKIKDQFLFNLPPSRQSFVYRGDTIHTSLLVFAENSVTKFSSCFERCRIWHIVYSCMMKRMRVSKPDITSNRVVCLHIAKTMLVYAQNELTLLQSYRSDWIQHVHTFRIGKLSLTLTFFSLSLSVVVFIRTCNAFIDSLNKILDIPLTQKCFVDGTTYFRRKLKKNL